MGWFVFIVRNKRELAKETEKLIGELRKRRFFWKPMKKRFVSGRNWPRVSNFRAKSSKRWSERYLLNLPIQRSVSRRSVSTGEQGVHARWEEGNPGCAGAALRQLGCVEGGAKVPPVCQVPRTEGELLRNRETVECSEAQRKARRRKL